MIDNKINDTVATSYDGRIIEDSTNSQQDTSETVTNKNDKEIRKYRYTSPKERQKIIDDLRLIR